MMLYTLAATQSELVQEALTLMIVGMGVVFIGLILLMAASLLISQFGKAKGHATPAKSAAAQAAPSPAPAQPAGTRSDQLDPKIVAVIAAAAARASQQHDPRLIAILTAAATAALNKPVHILTARRYLGAKQNPIHPWSQMGRRTIMTSHRPHRK